MESNHRDIWVKIGELMPKCSVTGNPAALPAELTTHDAEFPLHSEGGTHATYFSHSYDMMAYEHTGDE